jgi:hypothetical protein
VPSGRHRKTTPPQRRLQRGAACAAAVLTAAAAVPVAFALQPDGHQVPAAATAAHQPRAESERAAAHTVSRTLVREPPAPTMADVDGLAVVAPGAGKPARVHRAVAGRDHQTEHKPADHRRTDRGAAAAAGVSAAPCPDGSSVESGLTAHAVAVYRAVCAAFPAVSSWGGRTGSGGEHSMGLALDIMCPTSSLGDAISAWVREHAHVLGVSQVIWSQHIWTVQRGGEGWRAMPDRGSTTANHYDHVHVTVY